jgi:hypothetical protein
MTAEQISISELLSMGITPDADEAVAVALELMRDGSIATSSSPPHEPPLPENVYLGSDGSVVCRGCGTPLAVSDVALFLRRLLPIGTAGVPGALHYTIARALQEVDAPPFDSAEDFSRALARFEHGDGAQFLRALMERTQTNDGVTLQPSAEQGSAILTAAPVRAWTRVAVVAWVTAAATLLASGEAIHRWLAVPPGTTAMREAQPHDVVLDAPVPEAPAVSVPQPMPRLTARATRLPAKAGPRRASRSEPPHGKRGIFERLHLHWLHRVFTRRA